jgi:hypothetical protein
MKEEVKIFEKLLRKTAELKEDKEIFESVADTIVERNVRRRAKDEGL